MLQMQKATISKVCLCFSDGKIFSMLLVNMCSRVHVEQLCPAGLEGFANICIQTGLQRSWRHPCEVCGESHCGRCLPQNET